MTDLASRRFNAVGLIVVMIALAFIIVHELVRNWWQRKRRTGLQLLGYWVIDGDRRTFVPFNQSGDPPLAEDLPQDPPAST